MSEYSIPSLLSHLPESSDRVTIVNPTTGQKIYDLPQLTVSQVAKAVAERARSHYRSASQYVYPDKRRLLVASEMMASVYWRILLKIEKSDGSFVERDVRRIIREVARLTTMSKSSISPGRGTINIATIAMTPTPITTSDWLYHFFSETV